jgi:hypothetical protein
VSVPVESFFCEGGGCVVPARGRVPADPSERAHPADVSTVGCNRLRCSQCGEWVRNQAGLQFAGEGPGAATLMATADWRTLPGADTVSDARIYACACAVWQADVSRRVDDKPDVLEMPLPEWRCGGHPAAALPLDVDGESIGAATDLDALAERVIGSWIPPQVRDGTMRDCPPYWLARLMGRLEGLAAGEELASAMAARLDAPEEGPRAAAFLFFARHPRAPGFARLLEQCERHPGRVGERLAIPCKSSFRREISAADVLARRLESAPAGGGDELDRRAQKILRRTAAQAGDALSEDVFGALARVDGEWLARNAPALERARPGAWRPLLESLEADGRDEYVIVAAVALMRAPGGVEPQAIRDWVGEGLRMLRGFGLPLAAAAAQAPRGDPRPALRELEAAVRSGVDAETARSLGERLARAEPETLFDAAVQLAGEADAVRRAFYEGARGGDPLWFVRGGAELALALDVPE